MFLIYDWDGNLMDFEHLGDEHDISRQEYEIIERGE